MARNFVAVLRAAAALAMESKLHRVEELEYLERYPARSRAVLRIAGQHSKLVQLAAIGRDEAFALRQNRVARWIRRDHSAEKHHPVGFQLIAFLLVIADGSSSPGESSPTVVALWRLLN